MAVLVCFGPKIAGIDAPAASVDLVNKLKNQNNFGLGILFTNLPGFDAPAASVDLVKRDEIKNDSLNNICFLKEPAGTHRQGKKL